MHVVELGHRACSAGLSRPRGNDPVENRRSLSQKNRLRFRLGRRGRTANTRNPYGIRFGIERFDCVAFAAQLTVCRHLGQVERQTPEIPSSRRSAFCNLWRLWNREKVSAVPPGISYDCAPLVSAIGSLCISVMMVTDGWVLGFREIGRASC